MITKLELLNNQYMNSGDSLFEREIFDETGIKYYIKLLHKNNTWSCYVKFEGAVNEITITLWPIKKSLKEFEKYIDDLWEHLECHYLNLY